MKNIMENKEEMNKQELENTYLTFYSYNKLFGIKHFVDREEEFSI